VKPFSNLNRRHRTTRFDFFTRTLVRNKRSILYHLVIACAAAIYAQFFGWHGIIEIGDIASTFSIFPSVSQTPEHFLINLYVNGGLVYPGFPWILNLTTMPYRLTLQLFSYLGFSSQISNRIYLFLPLFLVAESGGLFAAKVSRTNSLIVKGLIAGFTISNPYILSNFIAGEPIRIVAIAAMLFLLAMFTSAQEDLNKKLRYIVLGSLASIFIVGDPGLALITAFLLVIQVLFYSMEGHKRFFSSIILLLEIGVMVLLANLWWIFPFFYSWNSSSSIFQGTSGIAVLKFEAPYVPFSAVFRFLYNYNFIIPTWEYYTTIVGATVGFVILAFGIISLLVKRQTKALYCSALLILGYMFATGVRYNVISSIYLFLYDKAPLFNIYRDAFDYFALVALIGLMGLLAITTSSLLRELAARKYLIASKNRLMLGKYSLAIALLLLIVLNGVPVYTQSVPKELFPIDVPTSYNQIHNYFERLSLTNGSDFRVAILPLVDSYIRYNWSGYLLVDITDQFIPTQVIEGLPSLELQGAEGQVNSALQSDNGKAAVSYLLLLGTQYIVLHKDIEGFDWNATEGLLLSDQRVQKVMSTQDLDILKISGDFASFIVGSNSSELSTLARTSFVANLSDFRSSCGGFVGNITSQEVFLQGGKSGDGLACAAIYVGQVDAGDQVYVRISPIFGTPWVSLSTGLFPLSPPSNSSSYAPVNLGNGLWSITATNSSADGYIYLYSFSGDSMGKNYTFVEYNDTGSTSDVVISNLPSEESFPYTYSVEMNTNSSYLISNFAYDKGWEIFQGNVGPMNTLFASPIKNPHSSILNGSMNLWQLSENGTVTMIFMPVVYASLGLLLSCLTFIVLLLIRFRRRVSKAVNLIFALANSIFGRPNTSKEKILA
jgi:hypothetical protein